VVAAPSLAQLLIPDPEHTLLLRVAGESMEGAGIRHGDLLVVERQRRAKPGQVVVALVDGGFTLKRLIWRHNRWWLEAAHPAYPPLELGEGRLWGVATQVIRTLATPINTHTTLHKAPWAQPSC
jgi:DNA polymerase V